MKNEIKQFDAIYKAKNRIFFMAEYSKFVQLINSRKNESKSPADFEVFSIKSDKSFEYSFDDELQNTSKFNKSILSDSKENTDVVGLFTFTKESEIEPELLGSDNSSSKFVQDTAVNQSREILNTDRFMGNSDEVKVLKDKVSGLQSAQKKIKKELEKATLYYEKKIKTLENINANLFAEIRKSKNRTRRTVSYSHLPFKLKSEHCKQNSTISKVLSQQVGHEKTEVFYPNGVRAEMYSSGFRVFYYLNGDIKQEFPNSKQVYFFASEQTTKTTFPDGIKEFKFYNGQVDKYFPDGTKEIKYPDGVIKCIFQNGEAETVFPDKTIETVDCAGGKIIRHFDGRVETILPSRKVYKD